MLHCLRNRAWGIKMAWRGLRAGERGAGVSSSYPGGGAGGDHLSRPHPPVLKGVLDSERELPALDSLHGASHNRNARDLLA